MRVRAAALARDRVDRLDELGAHLKQAGVRERHDVAFTNPGLEELEDVLVNAIRHRARLRQQRDLVLALDLAGEDHDLLSVADVDPGVLELEEDGGLCYVVSARHTAYALLVERRADLLGRPPL